MLQLVNDVYHNLCKHKLIKTEKRLLAAISGGQDSICLVLILYLLQTQMQYVFDLIWFNHFWQKSSFFTMLHVSKCSYSLSLQITLGLPLTDVFSEQSARDWRHSATQRIYLFYRYDLCVQGHSKSDRTETVLFNLIRGTGMSGISALRRTSSQICSSKNSFYPMFLQFTKQTHWTTPSTTLFSIPQPVKNNSADTKFAKICSSRYRLVCLTSVRHNISRASSVASFPQNLMLKRGRGQEEIIFPYKPIPHFNDLCKNLNLDPFTADVSTPRVETSRRTRRHKNTRRGSVAAYAVRGNAQCKDASVKTSIGGRISDISKKAQPTPLAYLRQSSTGKIGSPANTCSAAACLYDRLKHYAVAQTSQLCAFPTQNKGQLSSNLHTR